MDEKVILDDFEITILPIMTTGTNCYVVCHLPTNELFVVDPAGEAKRIIRVIDEYLGELRYIFLTHAHYDHIGAAADLYDEYNVPGVIHKADSRMLRQAHHLAVAATGKPIRQLIGYRAFVKEPEFHFGGQQIQAIHTPGHTPGSVCYALEKFIFTGDTLRYEAADDTDGSQGNPQKLADSLKRLFERFSGRVILFPGRGKSWHISDARKWWKANNLHSTNPSLIA